MATAAQFANRRELPEIHVTTRASKEAIDTQLDLEKMLRAAVLEQWRYFRAAAPALLLAALTAFRSGIAVAPPHTLGAPMQEHMLRAGKVLSATRVLGRARIRKEVGLPIRARQNFAEVLYGVGVEDAAQYIKSLDVVTQEEWSRLSRAAQQQAFTAAGVENKAALESLRDLVAEGYAKGWSESQFEFAAGELLASFSSEAGNLRTLWNTVTASAIAKGRNEELDRPEVKAIVPYRMYDAILDAHTRPNHAALDGGIAPADWLGWGIYAPPNGYNCRCTLIGITGARSMKMLAASGFDLTEGVPLGAGPDIGFGKI